MTATRPLFGERPPLPRYGDAALSDLVPSLLAALGLGVGENVLGIPQTRRAVLLLIDGLGWEALHDAATHAPFLAELARRGRPITAGFPATTAASIASIGTGLPPGGHGLVGYVVREQGRLLNLLGWSTYARQPNVDLRREVPPERFQPEPTLFERLPGSAPVVEAVVPSFESTGLDRAVFRGVDAVRVYSLGDTAATAIARVRARPRGLTYVYHGQLDGTGHARGVGSAAWRLQLEHVDRLARHLAEGIDDDTLLVVTGDHGMVDTDDGRRVDLDARPDLLEGVELVGGEARARHLYVSSGAAPDVAARWREQLGRHCWVATRDEAVDGGWFGTPVPDRVRDRIGDVVVASADRTVLVQQHADSIQASFVGHHGSFLPEEQLVPLLLTS